MNILINSNKLKGIAVSKYSEIKKNSIQNEIVIRAIIKYI